MPLKAHAGDVPYLALAGRRTDATLSRLWLEHIFQRSKD